MALPLYAITLFVSAFILFLVQPMIGKMILPKLGGTPQVWNTCMVFFQMVLLAGYAYTHFVSSRLKLRQQLLLHGVLLLLPLAVLFLMPTNLFNLRETWRPSNLGANPIPDTLGILFMVIGLPFLVVSTSAPLLQKWFAYTGHPAAKDPYFLYGASNLGSLLSLLLYPFVIEPYMSVAHQTWMWTAGYFLLIGLFMACVALVWVPAAKVMFQGTTTPEEEKAAKLAEMTAAQAQAETSTAVAPGAPKAAGAAFKKGKPPHRAGHHAGRPDLPAEPPAALRSDEVTPWRRVRWVLLAAIPSSLMLGITTHITTDLSPIPLFWLIPLSLYLLSFILVFARWPVVWTEKPHLYMLYGQPVAIAGMLLMDAMGASSTAIWWSVFFHVLAFFFTVMVCHGELAKDRPSTRHLTEFYLWMSVGGMLGGMFNALFAPVVFTKLIELGVAVFAACLIRPVMKESGWIDDLLAGVSEPAGEAPAPAGRGLRGAAARAHQPSIARTGATPAMTYSLDVILPLGVMLLTFLLAFAMENMMFSLAGLFTSARSGQEATQRTALALTFGIPLVIACFYYARPVRFGLTIGAIMLVLAFYHNRGDRSEFNDRSFFGIISVKKAAQKVRMGEEERVAEYRQLIHGHINHGMNFMRPNDPKEVGQPTKDFSRLATTYYHRYGPAGRVMEQYNWFHPREDNVYPADARMPASQVGQVMAALGTAALPVANLVDVWSEPPFATVGLGTGTMASYGRPFQHVHYYEIDNQIKRLSLPEDRSKPYFTYLQEAAERGSEVQVLMGDARLRMALPYINHHAKEGKEKGGGPENFYHMMVVDAFSSDAIPAHLITKEAIQMYFEHLTEEGVLAVHTSNRFVDLPKVVAAVASDLGFAVLRGHDNAPFNKTGHFTSEWVMVARKPEYLSRLKELEPEGYDEAFRKGHPNVVAEPYWTIPVANSRYLWTDDYYNLMSVVK